MLVLQSFVVIIAALSAGISFYFSKKARKETRLQLDIQKAQIKQEYRAELRAWASEAVEAMRTAQAICETEVSGVGSPETEAQKIKVRISSLIDRGRWFFPNVDTSSYGVDKLPAFRGFRPIVLDALVDVYRSIDVKAQTDTEGDKSTINKIEKSIKMFVDEVQKVVGPTATENDLGNILPEQTDTLLK